MFKDQMTGGPVKTLADNVITWDPVVQSYVTYFKKLDGNWYREDLCENWSDPEIELVWEEFDKM